MKYLKYAQFHLNRFLEFEFLPLFQLINARMSDSKGEEEISMDENPLVTPVHHQDHPSPSVSTNEYPSSNEGEPIEDEVFTPLQEEAPAQKETDFIKPVRFIP